MTVVPNSTGLKLIEITFATVGRHRNSVTRELPLACFAVRDGVAHPVSVVPRRADAHYYLSDGKRWWDEDGTEYPSWAALLGPLYDEDEKLHPPEPVEQVEPEPVRTSVDISPGGPQIGMPPRPWK